MEVIQSAKKYVFKKYAGTVYDNDEYVGKVTEKGGRKVLYKFLLISPFKITPNSDFRVLQPLG